MKISDKKKRTPARSNSTLIKPQQSPPPERIPKAASVDSMEHAPRPDPRHHLAPSSKPALRPPNAPQARAPASAGKALLATRAPLLLKEVGHLAPWSANMKRVHRSDKGFLIAFPLKDTETHLQRLQDEERLMLELRAAGLPLPRVYSTSGDQPLCEFNEKPALITDWVEGYQADVWKIRGQLPTTVRQFFHDVPGEHRKQRGQALLDSLGAILNYFTKNKCIVDLQVIIESSTGIAKIIDPAQIYNDRVPAKHQPRHRETVEDLQQGLTLAEALLRQKSQEARPITKWSKTELENFWEIECKSVDHRFLEGVWEKLSPDPKRAETFETLMELAEILESSQWQEFVEEKEKKKKP